MASAFMLSLAYLGEHCSATDAARAFAAYITGNVASSLFGRLIAASVADHLGLAPTFLTLAGLNLLASPRPCRPDATDGAAAGRGPLGARRLGRDLRNPQLTASFAIGFCILFAFIGTFTS